MDDGKNKLADWLYQLVSFLERFVDPTSYAIHLVGAGAIAAMMLLVAVAVVMRYVFNNPILGDLELITFMLVIITSFSLAYCEVMKDHVSVRIAVDRLPHRAQEILGIFTDFLTLAFLVLITWHCVDQVHVLWIRGSRTIMLGVPLFPFAGILAFGCAVFALVVTRRILDSLSRMVKK